MLLSQYIQQLASRFGDAGIHCGHGTDNVHDEAVYLVFGALVLDFALSVNEQDRKLTPEEIQALDRLAAKRIDERVPAAYLLGRAWFAGFEFLCDRRALIPRSPIAELVANGFEPLLDAEPGRVLDLCCGGGCIGIACALRFPGCEVELADICGDALALARENIAFHGLGSRVQTTKSDLFDELHGKYDLILSNPPYVSRAEIEQLPLEYSHEPSLGLHGGSQGLEIPSRLLQQAGEYLNPGGCLILETGHSAQALQERFPKTRFLWLEFEHGGEGVCALNAEQLCSLFSNHATQRLRLTPCK